MKNIGAVVAMLVISTQVMAWDSSLGVSLYVWGSRVTNSDHSPELRASLIEMRDDAQRFLDAGDISPDLEKTISEIRDVEGENVAASEIARKLKRSVPSDL